MLRDRVRVILLGEWHGEPADALVALHAHRSAASIARFRAAHPDRGLAVVLSGTDLYRDLPDSRPAQQSLDLADRIVALQDEAPKRLSAPWRAKCDVIFQSAVPLARHGAKPRDRVDVVVVGHLRDEKDPRTLFAAVRELPAALPIRIRHIGAPLDAALGEEAAALAASEPRYRFAGALPHGLARAAMRRAHVLVHPSRMEGGANVIAEALTGGTSVIASRMEGNVGMLGADHPGYFPVGDAQALADALVRFHGSPAFRQALRAAEARRRALFAPARESANVRRLVRGLLAGERAVQFD